ncbi:PstS family phosphate ABC transporter substrate-binding protein [Elizabethkingia sp. JS20170427COW]|uniref:PstS family phosphate ABC transporter substrate-binding protein n=1 Tax=Elizabethkingia sp. JS20170427COW TaxID=2583851 RepID=UPI00210255BE|nr:substrate-binding domain-containing protein [Elizabethkingia sp. JS20170427COW]
MNKFFWLAILFFFFSCKEDVKNNYNNGSLTLAVDESFYDISDALSYRYMQVYPEAKIKIVKVKEREGLKGLLDQKYSTIVMSRPMHQDEIKAYEHKTNMKFQPAFFAADALVFVVPKDSPIQSISEEEIKNQLLDGSRNLILDGANTSNTDYLADKLKLNTSEMQFSVLKSNEEIIEDISKFSHHVGVIGLNTISRPYGEKAQELRSQIKILPINIKGKLIYPDRQNLKDQSYPFTRILYFLTNEGNFGIANGFIRYACTNIGQKIVDKNGLQPYYLFKREVQIK